VNPILIGLAAVAGFLILRTVFLRTRHMPKETLMELVKQGAQIVDVRTTQEFSQAHAHGSRNIPLDQLAARAAELDSSKPVVVCCASGARSSIAKSLLERAGFTAVHNAGPWQAVQG
jgi:phage shock protein E